MPGKHLDPSFETLAAPTPILFVASFRRQFQHQE